MSSHHYVLRAVDLDGCSCFLIFFLFVSYCHYGIVDIFFRLNEIIEEHLVNNSEHIFRTFPLLKLCFMIVAKDFWVVDQLLSAYGIIF